MKQLLEKMKARRTITSLKFILLLAFATAVNLQASENYLKVGLEWTVRAEYMSSQGEESYDVYYLLDAGVMPDGEEMLVVKKSLSKQGDFMPCDTLRVSGDKVYYYVDTPSQKGWELLYDFSISIGDTVSVAIPGCQEGSSNCQALRCMGMKDIDNQAGMKVLYMLEEELVEFDSSHHFNRGEWIVGLGSTNGIVSMPFFNSSGGSTTLLEASIDGTTIYSAPSGLTAPNIDNSEGSDIWYDLNGTIIGSRPTNNGLYIVRKGTKVEKMIIH